MLSLYNSQMTVIDQYLSSLWFISFYVIDFFCYYYIPFFSIYFKVNFMFFFLVSQAVRLAK